MKKLIVILILGTTPTIAGETPKYHAIDEIQEQANSYISTLEAQRNAALNQVVTLTAELEKLKKSCEKSKR